MAARPSCGAVQALLCTLVGMTMPALAEDQQGLLLAAQDAMEQERPEQVIRLLRGSAHSPDLRKIFAQALAQAVDPSEALRWLQLPPDGADLPLRDAWLGEWPEHLRGPVAAQVGDWCAMEERNDAIWWWTMALDQTGSGVNANRLLLAIAEYAAQQERWQIVSSSTETLWQRRAPWVYRQAAGELHGRALLHLAPQQGRDFLLALLVHPELDDAAHYRVAVLLARAFLHTEPSLALLVTEQSLRRNQEQPGELPLWRTAALAQLDPQRAAQALSQLPAEYAKHPSLRHLAAAPAVQDPLEQALGRAEAAIVLEEWAQAQRHLEPWYRSDSMALSLWVRIPQVPLDNLFTSVAFAHPETALQVIRRLWREELWQEVSQALSQALQLTDLGHDQRLRMLHLALRLAHNHAHGDATALSEELRSYREVHPGVGEAWVLHARQQESDPAALDAWLQAVRYLPAHAPWAPIAAQQSLRRILAEHSAWSVADIPDPRLVDLRTQLVAIAQAHAENTEMQASLWLIAQALYALGAQDQARAVLERMHGHADGPGQARIQRILAQW
ncbi:MAG: hypothetical protein EA401_06180 [Planctomycetota bacterium]|nr:MAG: hypothetical protein EA401_06180 [Planctomycetota bacterium]